MEKDDFVGFFKGPPPIVGRYSFGKSGLVSIAIEKRPNWLARVLMRLLLDMHWQDGLG